MPVEVPICVCHHPLDYHDALTAECLSKGCGCFNFQDSGSKETIQ